MEVTVLYFAAVRERLGVEEESIAVEAGGEAPRVEDVWREIAEQHPELADLRGGIRLALNEEFVGDDEPVEAGDTVALIPPVAGGSGDEGARYDVVREPIAVQQVADRVRRPEAGGVVVFTGEVRNETEGHAVERLEYEAYEEMARGKLVETGRIAEERWSETSVAIHHRIGDLAVGDVAVVVAVSSPHRAAAFEACRFAIDHLKDEVPIWKKEVGPEGESWVGWGP